MKKYSNETIVGIFVVLGLAAISFMAVRIGNISIAGDNSYSLYAPFSTVSGLRVGNAVEMMGIDVEALLAQGLGIFIFGTAEIYPVALILLGVEHRREKLSRHGRGTSYVENAHLTIQNSKW